MRDSKCFWKTNSQRRFSTRTDYQWIYPKDSLPPEIPIRARVMQGAGSFMLKTGLLGAIPEELWRYLIKKFLLKIPVMIEHIFHRGAPLF